MLPESISATRGSPRPPTAWSGNAGSIQANMSGVGTQVISVVPLRHRYVIANYKETQLTHLRIGQRVEVRVDHSPGSCCCMATWRPGRQRPARSSHCCRRTMPPAISPKSCSACPCPVIRRQARRSAAPGMSVEITIHTDDRSGEAARNEWRADPARAGSPPRGAAAPPCTRPFVGIAAVLVGAVVTQPFTAASPHSASPTCGDRCMPAWTGAGSPPRLPSAKCASVLSRPGSGSCSAHGACS